MGAAGTAAAATLASLEQTVVETGEQVAKSFAMIDFINESQSEIDDFHNAESSMDERVEQARTPDHRGILLGEHPRKIIRDSNIKELINGMLSAQDAVATNRRAISAAASGEGGETSWVTGGMIAAKKFRMPS